MNSRSNSGAQHLDGDLAFAIAVFHARPVNLGNRGGGDRLSETYKDAVERFAEGDLNGRDRDRARKRRHPVLQKLELLNDGPADDVWPCREELAELDIGWPEPADRGGEIGKAGCLFSGGLGPGSPRAAQANQSCQGERQPRRGGQNRWIDVPEYASPGQHETRARKPEQGTEGRTQNACPSAWSDPEGPDRVSTWFACGRSDGDRLLGILKSCSCSH